MGLAQVDIGVCRVIFNGVDLGNTLDGIEVTIDRKFVDLMVDKYGETPVDKALTGQALSVKFKLAEPTVANIQRIYPEGDVENGTQGTRVGIGHTAGLLMKASAAPLVLRPFKWVASGSDIEDINIYKAFNSNSVMLPLKVKDQKVIECVFTALVDETYGDGRRLGHIGPMTIS